MVDEVFCIQSNVWWKAKQKKMKSLAVQHQVTHRAVVGACTREALIAVDYKRQAF